MVCHNIRNDDLSENFVTVFSKKLASELRIRRLICRQYSEYFSQCLKIVVPIILVFVLLFFFFYESVNLFSQLIMIFEKLSAFSVKALVYELLHKMFGNVVILLRFLPFIIGTLKSKNILKL
jgi:predicted PurR-regulated permease PerM